MPESYKLKILEAVSRIVDHGYGKVTIHAERIKGDKIKLVVEHGISEIYFIKTHINLDRDNII